MDGEIAIYSLHILRLWYKLHSTETQEDVEYSFSIQRIYCNNYLYFQNALNFP